MELPNHIVNLALIDHAMLTTGISFAFVAARGIEHFRFPADAHFYKLESPSNVDATGMLVAAIYGLCVTLFVIAVRARDFWLSPGKTLALLFATMCILNWSLEFIAAAVMNVRMQTDLAAGAVDHRGYILGIWYRRFAVDIGYVACLPVLFLVMYKTKNQAFCWRLAWAGFVMFALSIIGYVHFGIGSHIGPLLDSWYFEIAIGIPICLLIAATARSLVRRDPIDWWTMLTVIPVVCVWCVGIAIKAFA